MNAAIGVADHSGWAVVVALGGGLDAPTVLLRERIATLPANLPRQPYHAVAEEGAPRETVAEVAAAAYAASVQELRRLIGALRDAGLDLTQVAVAAGTSRIPAELDRILASHTLLHAAEGELDRTAIAEAATRLFIDSCCPID